MAAPKIQMDSIWKPSVPMKSANVEQRERGRFGSCIQDRQTAQIAALGAVEEDLDTTIAGHGCIRGLCFITTVILHACVEPTNM